MTAGPLPDVVAPCGCILRCVEVPVGAPELHVIPCHDGCTIVQAAIDAAANAGIPVEERRDVLP